MLLRQCCQWVLERFLGKRQDLIFIILYSFECFSGVRIPQFDCLIETATHNGFTIRAQCRNCANGVSFKRFSAASSLRIPELSCTITAATQKTIILSTEGQGGDPTRMPLQDVLTLTCLGVPQSDGLVITTTGNPLTIQAPGNGEEEGFPSGCSASNFSLTLDPVWLRKYVMRLLRRSLQSRASKFAHHSTKLGHLKLALEVRRLPK
jgi:hypothetical protein